MNNCMAPWTHTYLSPQGERRLCCASREPSQNFKQYIDTDKETDSSVNLLSLEEHWNSEHMKSVRRRMMAGETLPECEVCNKKLLNTDVYRDYFEHLFGHKRDELLSKTDEDGTFREHPISYDYRFSNLCSFKCRMCGPMLSSSWETEHKMLNKPNEDWMDYSEEIQQFQRDVIEPEFAQAIKEKRIEEIYWVGGEPLMFSQHWKYMPMIVDLGYADKVRVRYNTNLSRITYKNHNLYDILGNFKHWEICASLDGTGDIGEYIRTGLKYDDFLKNYEEGMKAQTYPNQMRLDFTLTTPGLFDLDNILELTDSLQTRLLAKVCFAFTPDILMSPMSLPRDILDDIVDDFLSRNEQKENARNKPLFDVIRNLKHRPTFQEQWPDEFINGWKKGKHRILELEEIRNQSVVFEDIIKYNKDVLDWWKNI